MQSAAIQIFASLIVRIATMRDKRKFFNRGEQQWQHICKTQTKVHAARR
jgi:hypothetical protein